MSDNTNDIKTLERKLRRLINVVIEKAQSDSDFANQLVKILNPSKVSDSSETEKNDKVVFNSVDILHREGREALQRELEFRTDTELKDILRQEGVRNQKGQKPFVRTDAILTIITRAEQQLRQGASFLKTSPTPQE